MDAQSKRRFLIGYKEFTGCQRCPERRVVCLELHHREQVNRRTSGLNHSQQRKRDVGSLVAQNKSLTRIVGELEKCEVICANCHKVETATANGW